MTARINITADLTVSSFQRPPPIAEDMPAARSKGQSGTVIKMTTDTGEAFSKLGCEHKEARRQSQRQDQMYNATLESPECWRPLR